MARIEEKIEGLEARLRALKARKARLEARRRSAETQRERKADTRRKILVGAVVLAEVDKGTLPYDTLRGWLDRALAREDDRHLFGLGRGSTSLAEESPRR